MILLLIYYILLLNYMYFVMRKIFIFYKSKIIDFFVFIEECMCIGLLFGFVVIF